MSAGTIQVAIPPAAGTGAGSPGTPGDTASGRDVLSVGDIIAPDVVLVDAAGIYAAHVPRRFLPERVKFARALAESGVYAQVTIGGVDLFPGGAVLLPPGDEVTTVAADQLDPDLRADGLPVDARMEVELTIVVAGYGLGSGDSEGLRMDAWGAWLDEI